MVLGVVFSLLGIGMLVALMFNMATPRAAPVRRCRCRPVCLRHRARARWAQLPSDLLPALRHSALVRSSW